MTMKIHRAEIVPDEDYNEAGFTVLLCMVEVDGKIINNILVPVDDYSFAYSVQNHCNTSVEPFILDTENVDV